MTGKRKFTKVKPFKEGDTVQVVITGNQDLREVTTGRFVSKFKPEFAQTVIEMSQAGYTLEAIAGHLGVTRDTMHRWQRKYPEFKEVCTIARGKRQLFWEEKLIKSESGPAVQAASLSLRASDMHNFNDRRQIDIKLETKSFDYSKLSIDQLKQLRSIAEQAVMIEHDIEDADYEEI